MRIFAVALMAMRQSDEMYTATSMPAIVYVESDERVAHQMAMENCLEKLPTPEYSHHSVSLIEIPRDLILRAANSKPKKEFSVSDIWRDDTD